MSSCVLISTVSNTQNKFLEISCEIATMKSRNFRCSAAWFPRNGARDKWQDVSKVACNLNEGSNTGRCNPYRVLLEKTQIILKLLGNIDRGEL